MFHDFVTCRSSQILNYRNLFLFKKIKILNVRFFVKCLLYHIKFLLAFERLSGVVKTLNFI